MRRAALLAGLVLAIATAAVVVIIRGHGNDAPGFLGPGTLVADVNLVLEVLLVLGVTFGFWLARRGSIEAHRINQTSWVLVNAALVALIMVASMENVAIATTADLANPRMAFAWLHAALGACTVAAGLWLVLQMNDVLPQRVHLRGWKTLMRLTLAGYWAVGLLGFATYYFFYAA
jgi:hypothetical protein